MQLTSIQIFPIKATRAIPLQEAEVRARGLAFDRRWVVVDEGGRFRSQREHPQLGFVSTTLQADGSLTLHAPGMPPLDVSPSDVETRMTVSVWDDTFVAARMSAEPAKWFSKYLDAPSALIYMDRDTVRPVAPAYGQPGDVVSFADAVPLLLANDASLVDLNRRLPYPIAMSRFRTNITVDADEAWAEDHWKRIRVGSVEFQITHPCARCVVTTIDQDTGQKAGDGEPLKTMATFRRDERGVNFGQNLVPRTLGIIRVGDRVEILE